MLVRLLVEVDIFSVPLLWIGKRKKNNILLYKVPQFLFDEVLTQ